MRALAALLLALPLASSAGAPESVVSPAVARFNRAAVFPLPTLDPGQLADLEKGKVVKIIDRSGARDQPARAIALKLSSHSQPALWVASLDPHLTVDPDLTESRLDKADGKELWYGYYDLPYPFADRHWVIESWNNRALATATGGAAWEHAWKLAPHREAEALSAVRLGKVEGVEPEWVDSAVKTPHNHGAWLVLALEDGRSLLGYHATSTVGGSVPDWLVLQLVQSKLDALLKRVDDRCDELVPSHYTAVHPDLEGGDGLPLTWRP